MRHAVLPKDDPANPLRGIPDVLVPDHGKDFMSHSVALLVRALGVRLEPTPPYYPDMKGEVERFFRSLDSYLTQLTGHMRAEGRSRGAAKLRVPSLLTLPQLRAEVAGFIAEYHARKHRITGEQPIVLWERTAHLSVPTVEEINVLMLKADQFRKVRQGSINFTIDGQGGKYIAEELQHHLGEEVQIRYNPDDLESILVYAAHTAEFLCEAWLEGTRYTVEQVKRWRRGFREELQMRTTAYWEEMRRDDGRSAKAWDDAREQARALQQAEAESTADSADDTSVIDGYLERFRRRDRGSAESPRGNPGIPESPSGNVSREDCA
jgi:putative transposase